MTDPDPDLVRLVSIAHDRAKHIAHNVDPVRLYTEASRAAERIPEPLGTALLLAGVDPDIDRREYAQRPDLRPHNPVEDALAAALCWQRAVETLR